LQDHCLLARGWHGSALSGCSSEASTVIRMCGGYWQVKITQVVIRWRWCWQHVDRERGVVYVSRR
jgi:hypothetical protein